MGIEWVPLISFAALYIGNEVHKKITSTKQSEELHEMWRTSQRTEPLLQDSLEMLQKLSINQEMTARILERIIDKLDKLK